MAINSEDWWSATVEIAADDGSSHDIDIIAATTTPTAAIVAAITDRIVLEHAPQLTKSALMRFYVLGAMGIVSLIGNLGTIWNICKTRQTRRVTRHSWSAIYFLILRKGVVESILKYTCKNYLFLISFLLGR